MCGSGRGEGEDRLRYEMNVLVTLKRFKICMGEDSEESHTLDPSPSWRTAVARARFVWYVLIWTFVWFEGTLHTIVWLLNVWLPRALAIEH